MILKILFYLLLGFLFLVVLISVFGEKIAGIFLGIRAKKKIKENTLKKVVGKQIMNDVIPYEERAVCNNCKNDTWTMNVTRKSPEEAFVLCSKCGEPRLQRTR